MAANIDIGAQEGHGAHPNAGVVEMESRTVGGRSRTQSNSNGLVKTGDPAGLSPGRQPGSELSPQDGLEVVGRRGEHVGRLQGEFFGHLEAGVELSHVRKAKVISCPD